MFEEMRKLAEKYHAGQMRDGDEGIPYIEHPKAVVQNLLDWGESRESPAVVMAWGHDLLEDTAVSEAELLAASDEAVLKGIRRLTHDEDIPKSLYLREVARSGDRDALLVKISDRIQNSRDFARGKGPLRAFRYLHDAECIFDAVKNLPQDPVLVHALDAWKELDETLREPARHEALRGCLLGGAVGDALGAPVEFMSEKEIRRQYGKNGVTTFVEFPDGTGSITDDTQMTLFTAEGILRAHVGKIEKGNCDSVAVMRNACRRWLKTQGGRVPATTPEEALNSGWLIREGQLFARRAPGNTCLSALEIPADLEKAPNKSKGCGTVMRMAPAGLFFAPEEAYDCGCRFSALTHGHPTGITAGGAFAMLIAELLAGKPLEEALELVLEHLGGKPDAAETASALRKAREAENISELGEGWIAEEALAIGVFCALKHPWELREAILEAVNIDGDSDSTGSITGNILGVIKGESAIPTEWRSRLREKEIVSKMADDLWKRFEADENGRATPNWLDKYPGF